MIPKKLIYLISIIGCVIFYYALKVVYFDNDELFIYGCVIGVAYLITTAGLVSIMMKSKSNTICITLFLMVSAIPFVIMSKGEVTNVTIDDEIPYKFEKFELALDEKEEKIIVKGEVKFDNGESEKLELDKKTMLIHFADTDDVSVKRIRRVVNIYYPFIDFRTRNLKNDIEKYLVIIPDKDEETLLQVFPEIKEIKR